MLRISGFGIKNKCTNCPLTFYNFTAFQKEAYIFTLSIGTFDPISRAWILETENPSRRYLMSKEDVSIEQC